jgi:hypothetical protein
VRAGRVDARGVAQVGEMVSGLEGGAGAVTPDAVATAYAPVLEGGNIYSYPATTADGGRILTLAQTQSSSGILAWRTPRVAIMRGVLASPFGYQTVGHEGAHLVSRMLRLGLSETQVSAIGWRRR